eukprot:SAG11_NODE_660_length_7893_cov_4.055042_2_plen_97_part_00
METVPLSISESRSPTDATEGQPYAADQSFHWIMAAGCRTEASCSHHACITSYMGMTSSLLVNYIDRLDLRPWSTAGGSRSARSLKSLLVDIRRSKI